MLKLACVQMDVMLGQPEANVARMQQHFRTARATGAELVVFPECAVQGYAWDTAEEVQFAAQSLDGPAVNAMRDVCRTEGGAAVFGLIEADHRAQYNTAVVVTGEGVLFRYRKTHLPYIGADRFHQYGDGPLTPFEYGGVRIGLLICYDGGFPEPPRVLALAGADLIVLPTNWPVGAEGFAEHGMQVRAIENTVYMASCDRIGEERGGGYVGRSRICDPLGRTLGSADGVEETILYAEIDPLLARRKHLVRRPGLNEINRIADRRPELYGELGQPQFLPRPGGR